MPTGYTAAIKDGISFETFVMDCARAFGACVTMRDDPKDKPIPTFETSSYNQVQLKEAKKRLAELKEMTPFDAVQGANAEYDLIIANAKKGIEVDLALKEAYLSMLSEVRKWTPPTPDHVGLRDFMVEQIESSIKFDCNRTWHTKALNSKKLTGEEWIAEEFAKTYLNIDYHTGEQKKEEERVSGRNKWVDDLRRSLKIE